MKLMAWIPAFLTEFTMGFITIIHHHWRENIPWKLFPRHLKKQIQVNTLHQLISKYPVIYRISYMLGGAGFLPSTVFEYSLPVARPISVHSVHSSYGDHSSGHNVVKAVQHAGEKHEGSWGVWVPKIGSLKSLSINLWDRSTHSEFTTWKITWKWRWMEDDVPFPFGAIFRFIFRGVGVFLGRNSGRGSWISFQNWFVFCWLFLEGCSATTIDRSMDP